MKELEHHRPHDVVDAGAKAAARHDPDGRLRRIEEELLARPRPLEEQRLGRAPVRSSFYVVEHTRVVANVPPGLACDPELQRRRDPAGSERPHREALL
jgi:hypothetical protein